MIGILGLQGDIEEHRSYLFPHCNEVRIVKTPADLGGIKGLIIPGGESTAITKLIRSVSLDAPVMGLIREGLPVWGTCAGTILLCKGGIWASVNAEVARNAYGPQLYSCVKQGTIRGRENPIPMVFIRAPRITSAGRGVEILSDIDGDIVAVRQGSILLSTFHPELTRDSLFLSLFLELVDARRKGPGALHQMQET